MMVLGLIATTYGAGLYCDADLSLVKIEVDVTLKLAVSNCYGAYSHCDVTITGVPSKPLLFDLSKTPITKLGKIEDKTLKFIDLPVKMGTRKVYSFIPTKEELEGKLVYVTFENINPGRGRTAGMNVIKVYRHLENEKPDYWIQAGLMESARPFKQLGFIITPDGTWTTYDPKKDGAVNLPLGKKDMSKKTT